MSARAKADDVPVYDERGNVRPHGTPGARPMTFEERRAIALADLEGPSRKDPVERKPAKKAAAKKTAAKRSGK